MSRLRRNVLANFGAKLWSVALGLFFPPVLVRLLGIESYGLVGLFGTMSAVLGLLDLGLSTTLQRHLASLPDDPSPEAAQRARDLVRTFEAVFWGTGLAAGLLLTLGAPVVVDRWIHVETLPRLATIDAIRVMGLVFALQWCGIVYSGALMGLQRQVSANVISMVGSLLRQVGGALVVWKVWPSATGYFASTALAMGVQAALGAAWLSRSLRRGPARGSFRWTLLRDSWRFSAGTWAISLLGLPLNQLDKILVSKLLPLEMLGYYTLATTASASLSYLAVPVYMAVFPRLCQLAASGDDAEAARVYQQSAQGLCVLLAAVAAGLCVFSGEALLAWTGDPATVRNASGILVFLTIGTAINGLMHLPYALQLAYGWTRLSLLTNVVAVPVMIPLTYWLGSRFGAVGMAASWVVVNAGYVVGQVPLMHRRVLKGELGRWYRDAFALPVLGAGAGALGCRWLLGHPSGRLGALASLVLAGAVSLVASALVTPATRAWLARRLMRAVPTGGT